MTAKLKSTLQMLTCAAVLLGASGCIFVDHEHHHHYHEHDDAAIVVRP